MITLDNFIRALYHVCKNNYSGQWTTGYRILCLCQLYAKRWDINLFTRPTRQEKQLYEELEAKYGERL